jgi:hypothetical protein
MTRDSRGDKIKNALRILEPCEGHYASSAVVAEALAALRDQRYRPAMRHGTRSMYQGRGCRCDECRKANSEYVAERRRNGN